MNYFWEKTKSEKMGIYNKTELTKRLGLSEVRFNELLALEVERYSKSLKQKGKLYYEDKIEKNPLILKYGNTPTFPNSPYKNKTCIFNNTSGVYLEKMWSSKNKYNEGKKLPFDFIFKQDEVI